jgi:predicted metal-dependent phosphoesterase TrpH
MIVINESGKVITSRDKLPAEIATKVDYSKISRSFTPAQRQNLIYRFKMVPPRVLYVPEQLTSKTARGTYVVYKKKFWYWKKEDGLFHLDETYYQ